MPTARLTSKGQLTLPRKVRELLRVQTGDSVDFVIGADGEIRLRAGDLDVRDLRGMLHKPGRKSVPLEQMDEAIALARGRHP